MWIAQEKRLEVHQTDSKMVKSLSRMPLSFFVLILFVPTLVSCSYSKNINGALKRDVRYKGWFVVTNNGRFFIIERQGLFKKNWMFNLPEFPVLCYATPVIDSILYSNCNLKKKPTKVSFRVGKSNSSEFYEPIFVYNAVGNFLEYKSYTQDSNYVNRHRPHKIKITNGTQTISGVLHEGFSYFKNIALYAACTHDSIRITKCDSLSIY
jgi:hypothetical protein